MPSTDPRPDGPTLVLESTGKAGRRRLPKDLDAFVGEIATTDRWRAAA